MARSPLVLGIDFGTSFSTAAAWVDERLYMVTDERGEPCIPSVVHVPSRGDPTVGFRATQLGLREPQLCIRGIKRVLGRPPDHPAFRIFEAQNAALVRSGPRKTAIIKVAGRDFTPEQLAAEIFRALKAQAEARFRLPVKKAVVTLPASADAAQREATKKAAQMAGLLVMKTIPEPAAGAMAYGLDRRDVQDRRLLVYDFGGGTFDVTVLRQTGPKLQPLSLGGDPLLGGDDLDEALAQQVASQIWRQYKVRLDADVVRWQRVLQQTEQVKRALSGTDEVRLRIRDLFSAGPLRDLDLPVTRLDTDPRWRPLVDRTVKVTVQTMVQSRLRPDDIDEVVLVGGSTYVPLVRQVVETVLKKPGIQGDDPQTAVAAGAALMAGRVMKMAA